MSRTLDRRRVAKKYANELHALNTSEDVEVLGEAGDDALLYSGLAAELAKTAGGLAAQKQKNDAIKAAKQLRADADAAAKKAQDEKDPNGLLHRNAADLDERARNAELKAGITPGSSKKDESKPGAGPQSHSNTSKYLMWGLIGLGGLVGLGVTYKLIKGKK